MSQRKDAMTDCDQVIAAAKTAMQTVIDTARRTNTPHIVMCDGQIEHLTPDQILNPNNEARVP